MADPVPGLTITHDPCCSSHGVPMDCARYRRTHFVEVRPCCSVDAEALRAAARPNDGGPSLNEFLASKGER